MRWFVFVINEEKYNVNLMRLKTILDGKDAFFSSPSKNILFTIKSDL